MAQKKSSMGVNIEQKSKEYDDITEDRINEIIQLEERISNNEIKPKKERLFNFNFFQIIN